MICKKVTPSRGRTKHSQNMQFSHNRSNSHLFQNRDSSALQQIRFKAHQLLRHPAFGVSEREDVEQEFALALIKNYRQFDPKRACETTFIDRVIQSKAITLIRNRLAEKRDYRREGFSLNDDIHDTDGRRVERVQTLEEFSERNHTGQSTRTDGNQLEMRLDTAEVLNSLPQELRLLADLLKELSENASREELGQSRRQVASDVTRLRKRFEDAGLRDYL